MSIGLFSKLFIPMTQNMALLHVMVLYPIQNVRTRGSSGNEEMAAAKSFLSFVNTCDHNYTTFMAFLAREFSMENLLFLTEYVQLKKYIFGTMNMMEVQMQVKGHCDVLRLPQCAEFPVSDIVRQYEISQQTMDEETCFLIAVNRLFAKYISRGKAAHEINISFAVNHAIQTSVFGENVNKKMSDG
eukprot:329190_1